MKIFIVQNTQEAFKNNSSKALLEQLTKLYGWGPLHYSSNGKPLCEKGFLSVSHSLDFLVIVHNNHPIGIDLEKIRPLKDELIKKFDLDPNNPILSWCQKEALIKLYDNKHYLFKNITSEYWQTIDIDEKYCCVVVSKQALPDYELIEMKIN